jgi:hypothetical protein
MVHGGPDKATHKGVMPSFLNPTFELAGVRLPNPGSLVLAGLFVSAAAGLNLVDRVLAPAVVR